MVAVMDQLLLLHQEAQSHIHIHGISSPVQTTTTATGLSAGLYTVTVRDSNNCVAMASVTINDASAPPTATWTAGGGTTNWSNPANWSGNSVPNSNVNVVIPGNPAGGHIFPVIDIADAACGSLTIEAGASITVPTGITLSISRSFINNGNANLGQGTLNFDGCSEQTITGENQLTI